MLNSLGSKQCTLCGGVKPLSEFTSYTSINLEKYPNQTHYPRCRDCSRPKNSESARKNRQLRKRLVFSHYCNNQIACSCCGERDFGFLTIDHMYGGGNKHRKERNNQEIYKWLILHNFPTGYQVQCYNCNLGRARNGGVCPHEEKRLAAQAAD